MDGVDRLFVRRLDQLEYREILGSEGAQNPTFSPDGEWLAFAANGQVLRVQLSGGPVLPVAEGGSPHWGVDETIVFRGADDGIYLVSYSGVDPTSILDTTSATGGLLVGTSRPHLLPDGKAVLLQGPGPNGSNRPLLMVELESGLVTDLGIVGNNPRYAASGHLVYGHSDQALMAVAFDLETHEVTGEPRTVLQEVAVRGGGATSFVVSETGTAFYGSRAGTGAGVGDEQLLVVVDLEGNEEPTPLAPRFFGGPRWSPDGASVAYFGNEPGATDLGSNIYTYNVDLRTTPRPLTFEGININPVWSPDGTRVAFASLRDGTDGFDLFVKTLDDAPPEMIVSLPGSQLPTQWFSDDVLVFESNDPEDLWRVDPSSDPAVVTPYLKAEAELDDIMVSPGGDLAVYRSDESGTDEVYVRSFPDARQPEIVSQGGADFPFWSPGGDTIYYWAGASFSVFNTLVAAHIERGPPFVVVSRDTVLTGAYNSRNSDLHPDGDRLVVVTPNVTTNTVTGDAREPRHLIVVNWFEELKERMGGN